jgi:hypothetical protein
MRDLRSWWLPTPHGKIEGTLGTGLGAVRLDTTLRDVILPCPWSDVITPWCKSR